ncbi:hypothetical protein DL93DRAFT_2081024, partial [Clavulina sp. PMI_390]
MASPELATAELSERPWETTPTVGPSQPGPSSLHPSASSRRQHRPSSSHSQSGSGRARAETVSSTNTDSSQGHSSNSSKTRSLPWIIDDTGFAEPRSHPTEAGKVMSRQQPPGWSSGEIRMLWLGPFMNKMGGNQLLSGTVLRNGMKLWVDMRSMRELSLRKKDTCECFPVS